MKPDIQIDVKYAAGQEVIFVFLVYVDYVSENWPTKECYQVLEKRVGRKDGSNCRLAKPD